MTGAMLLRRKQRAGRVGQAKRQHPVMPVRASPGLTYLCSKRHWTCFPCDLASQQQGGCVSECFMEYARVPVTTVQESSESEQELNL
jgi:hypothetical protein